jgi:integrase
MRGIAVEKTERPPNMKAAATADVFAQMIEQAGGTRTKDIRDRAILRVGAVTGLRRAELVAVNVEDLTWHDQGVSILIRRSKTDQTGVGRYVAVPCDGEAEDQGRCAAHAIRAWLARAPSDRGPLFRSLRKDGRSSGARLPAEQISDIVKHAASAAGLDPKVYAAHSLRSGYVTQAAREGLSLMEIMEQTGHRKIESVRRYARDPVNPFRTGRVHVVARAFAGKKV